MILFDQGGMTGRRGSRDSASSGFIWMMPRMRRQGRVDGRDSGTGIRKGPQRWQRLAQKQGTGMGQTVKHCVRGCDVPKPVLSLPLGG